MASQPITPTPSANLIAILIGWHGCALAVMAATGNAAAGVATWLCMLWVTALAFELARAIRGRT